MKLIIISNRAPVHLVEEEGKFTVRDSSGGLASGLRTYVDKLKDAEPNIEITWMGWPGREVGDPEKVRTLLVEKHGTHPIFIPDEQMDKFYEGFCNNTIWPLFHYFPNFAEYDAEHWQIYIDVNKIFLEELMKVYEPGDVIWVHDYHLMLLPAMIREKHPEATIGFFLHIPFPSYEVFRLLPRQWRMTMLKGLYGADLIGFHTHDYRNYFLQSTLRILGLSDHMGDVNYFNRIVKVDSFPMGIDYAKFNAATRSTAVKKEIKKLRESLGKKKLILSIDRQDYSKGILNRLKGYVSFLDNNPELIDEVMMIMIIIPSRVGVADYMEIKSQIDELVGSINGKYGTLTGMPILYQYRTLSFDELIALYTISDIGLVTPLRDGMNLVAKEFLACKTKKKGVLILSEMAGASDELTEAIIINPNNIEEIGQALLEALELPEREQSERIELMQARLRDYDVFKWSESFMTSLFEAKAKQKKMMAKRLPDYVRSSMLDKFHKSNSRLLFLDYDGTLRAYAKVPALAEPEAKLIETLERLLAMDNLELVIISGRDWQTLDKWFGNLPMNLVAEHGLFIREKNKSWKIIKPVAENWKKEVFSVMSGFAEKLPGSLVEEKDYSLAFHFRRSDPELASLRVRELMNYLITLTSNLDVKMLRGNKVIEVRSAGIDKGIAAMHWIPNYKDPSRFILAIGDDLTDEDLFQVIPTDGYTLRVGQGSSIAMYNIDGVNEVIELLDQLGTDVVESRAKADYSGSL